MLSQRLVKLHLLQAAGVQAAHHAALLQESVQWVDSNFALLRKNLSQPTYGDLLALLKQGDDAVLALQGIGQTALIKIKRALRDEELIS